MDRSQGTLFGRVVRTRRPGPVADTAFSRWVLWSRLYRAKYKTEPTEGAAGIVAGRIKAWQAHLPTVAHWSAFCEAWLDVNIPAVVAAKHPLLWASRHVHYLIPTAQRRVVERQRVARASSEDAARVQAAQAAPTARPDRATLTTLHAQLARRRAVRDAEAAQQAAQRDRLYGSEAGDRA